ncbi:MAG: SHOCT domain-containing protein [Actinobacteria bacterium]|nr:SHOCT domain-containing protein [Actinomycetota bacterium]
MGGLPLLVALPAAGRAFRGTSPPVAPLAGLGAFRSVAPAIRLARRAAAARTGEGGLVPALERLDALHRSGALDDEEYEAAKDRLLREEPG